jgi:hypothetical protein
MDESEERMPQQCAVRVGEECRLCVPGASGPQDCGLAYLVMTDPELRDELARQQARLAERRAPGVEDHERPNQAGTYDPVPATLPALLSTD